MTLDTRPDSVTLAGRYRLAERLGRGATAEVWRGFDERLRRDVAVKLLDPVMAAEPGVRGRFESEARAAAGLCHPNIVSVFDTGEHDGLPFLVMELLDGRTLADEMACGPLPEARVRALGLEILDALDSSHRAGIIHRDIKPANVLLTEEGAAKIADFGIARSAGDHSITDTGQVIGTTNYMAPERAAGLPATPCSDIYGVGVLMYEALAGRKPFSADTPIEIIRAAQAGDVTGLEVLRPDIDPLLVATVSRAMAADPQLRYSSAASMASALSAPPAASGDVTVVTGTVTDATVVTEAAPASAVGAGGWPVAGRAVSAQSPEPSRGDATMSSPMPAAAYSPEEPSPARSLLRDRTLLLIGTVAAATLVLVLWAGGRDAPSPAVGDVESSEVASVPTTLVTPPPDPLAGIVANPSADESVAGAVDEAIEEIEDRGTRRQREREERRIERELQRALED